MVRVLVIGFGNILRGDDAIGPTAVEQLRVLMPGAELLSCMQLAPELAAPLAECDIAIFVDAAYEGEPGTVRIQSLSLEVADGASLSHQVSPAVLLAVAREVYGRAPRAILVTGTGASFVCGYGISEKGTEALNEICRLIPQLVTSSQWRT